MSCSRSSKIWSRFGAVLRRSRAKLAGCAAAVCLAGALIGNPGARAATETGQLQVAASINIRCTLITVPLAFGSYTPSDPTPLDVQGSISLNCTQSIINFIMHLRFAQGAQPAAGSTAAAPRRQMADGNGNFLRYDLYRNAARTQVWGDTIATAVFPGLGPYPLTLPVYGRVPALQNVQSGSYADTVTATLFF
jgi:spore coat protein U-like protein